MPPSLVLFDVNETLVDLESLRSRFERIGAPAHLLETWFSSTLRDGFALTAAGAYADFRTVAVEVLRGQLASQDLGIEPVEASEFVIDGFAELDLHEDVELGMRRFDEAGIRMATLTNGSAELTETLLGRGGVGDLVERTLSVSEVGRWKPAAEPYLHAARECGVPGEEVALVAAHPWDIAGAKRAGLLAGWLNRRRAPYPAFFDQPDVIGTTLTGVAEGLIELRD